MDIVIPTYGRAYAQTTYGTLRTHGFHPILVVQAREAKLYDNRFPNVHILPEHITTIAPTRQHILKHVGTHNELVMMDDDLWFYKRRRDDPSKFAEMEEQDYINMMADIDEGLKKYAHVGIASREGGNRNTAEFCYNTRIMRVLGYRRDILKKLDRRFDEMEVMEDFHIALTLLEQGYENVVLNNWCHNQAGSGKAGGCSHFRTAEVQTRNADRLSELHPGVVNVVRKTTKSAWGGGERTDVRVLWKKALNARRSSEASGFLD